VCQSVLTSLARDGGGNPIRSTKRDDRGRHSDCSKGSSKITFGLRPVSINLESHDRHWTKRRGQRGLRAANERNSFARGKEWVQQILYRTLKRIRGTTGGLVRPP